MSLGSATYGGSVDLSENPGNWGGGGGGPGYDPNRDSAWFRNLPDGNIDMDQGIRSGSGYALPPGQGYHNDSGILRGEKGSRDNPDNWDYYDQSGAQRNARNNTGNGGRTTSSSRLTANTAKATVSYFLAGKSMSTAQWQHLPVSYRNSIVRALNAKGWNLRNKNGKISKVARPQPAPTRERHRQHSRRRRRH